MKRLRHPIRAIREPFGTAGLVVACVALIAALGGTALAAAKLNSTQKKEVEKIAKKYAGKPGAAGAQGPAGAAGKDGSNGAAGEKGATGPQGAAGPKGDTGAAGSAGAAGKSPKIVEEFAVGDEGCEEKGGFEYEVPGSGEPAPVCNGKEGKDGKEGSPWTAKGTLPPGATETGTWATGIGTGEAPAAISFQLPLAKKILGTHVHIPGEAGFTASCLGGPNNTNRPKAAPGELCIYFGEHPNASVSKVTGPDGVQELNDNGEEVSTAGFAGAILFTQLAEGFATGSYAVTGCSEEAGAEFPCPS
jgi:hypothetical protein